MMNYNFAGGFGSSMMFFMWINYVLITVLLILSIMALWKYINKK